MALIECLECGKEISDKAESCPNCGAPTTAGYQAQAQAEVQATATAKLAKKESRKAAKKEKRKKKGRYQGVGCLTIIIGLFLVFLFPPLGGLLLIIGVVAFVASFLVS